jgi:signal transduction histidine kinase/ActR/RegA family two-component response regulator
LFCRGDIFTIAVSNFIEVLLDVDSCQYLFLQTDKVLGMHKSRRTFSSLNFAFKTSAVLSASMFVITIVLTFIIGVMARERIEYDQGTFLSELAYQFSRNLDQAINSRFGEIKVLSTLDALANPHHSEESKRAVIEKLAESFPEISWIGITDKQGRVIVSQKNILKGADVSQRPWFQEGAVKPSIGDVHNAVLLNKILGGTEKEPIRFVDFSAPLYYNGQFVGVLGAHLSITWTQAIGEDLLAPLKARFPVRLSIYSREWKLIIGDKERDILDLEKIQDMNSFGLYYISKEKSKKDLLVGVARMKYNPQDNYAGFGWVVALDRDADAAFAIARSLEYKILGVGFFIALALALLSLRYKQQEEKSLSLTANLGEAKAAEETAKAASEAKSHFLAAMSHEIRTPMNGVMGVTDLLLETDLNSQQKEYAQLIKISADSLLSIVNDILDYSKVEANKIDLESLPFSLLSVVEQTMSLMNLQARNKSLYLRLVRPIEGNLWVLGDPVRLRQVLINLISNALKFTSQGGVEVGITQEDLGNDQIRFRFSVKDSGIGIPQEAQKRIFERFEQVDTSTARKYGGTGLGLSISRSLVRLMHGEMGVESQPGQGATFWFTVVLKKTESPEVSQDLNKLNALGRPLRVLVAEDNSVNQLIVRAMLNKMGHEFKIVGNGREVLEALVTEHFDIVLMDCHMPEMDGYQTTAALRSKEKWQDLTIIALTASAMEGERDRCLQIGMNDYLSKPISAASLESMLQKYTKVHG